MLSHLTTAPEFQDWQWNLATRVREAMESVFARGVGEVPCVEAIVHAIADDGPVPSISLAGTRLEVEAAATFLHGSRSQVKFSIGGVEHQRELADLLVLGSFVEGGVLKWQRACFIQAKRGSAARASSGSRFAIDEWQLEGDKRVTTDYGGPDYGGHKTSLVQPSGRGVEIRAADG